MCYITKTYNIYYTEIQSYTWVWLAPTSNLPEEEQQEGMKYSVAAGEELMKSVTDWNIQLEEFRKYEGNEEFGIVEMMKLGMGLSVSILENQGASLRNPRSGHSHEDIDQIFGYLAG